MLVYDSRKESSLELCGFFNGSFYIGEWHPNTVEYLTRKSRKTPNEIKLRRTSSVLSAYSKCSDLCNDEMNGNEEVDGNIAASKMRNYYEQRSINRLGHFEFTMIEEDHDGNDENGKGSNRKKKRLMQDVRGGVMSVNMRNDDGVELDRQRSLDSDDDNEEDHDRIDIDYPDDNVGNDHRFIDTRTENDHNFFDDQW